MWTHQQSTGILIAPDGEIESHGYSGQPPYVNDVTAQGMHGLGPCPVGLYTIGPWHDDEKLGPCVARLIPDPDNYMFGRDDFYIHGDDIARPGYGSDGCLVHGRAARISVKVSGDNRLKVE